MSDNKNTPLYLVPETDPIVKQYASVFKQLEEGDKKIVLDVEPSAVNEGHVAMVQQMVIAMQHYHHLIEKAIFGISFNFKMFDGIDGPLFCDSIRSLVMDHRIVYTENIQSKVFYILRNKFKSSGWFIDTVLLLPMILNEVEFRTFNKQTADL